MAIGRSFGQAFGKALRSRELDALPSVTGPDEELLTRLESPGADRYDLILELQRRGVSDGELRARTEAEFEQIVAQGLAASPIGQILIDESVLGWCEFELEVMR